MREQFINRKFKPESLEIIERANEICANMRNQGYNLTLRQLYYQFIKNAWLPNTDRSYKNLGGIINDARLAGLLDWSYLEDRTRNVAGGYYNGSTPGAMIARYARFYTEPLWKGQSYRPEVWVEKEALADIVGQAASPYRVPTFSCRGYVSQSEMYAAAKRFERRADDGRIPLVIHLGDHDPSGIDMTRDIAHRLGLMSGGYDIEVRRIALNRDQIEQYNPPPNPAKVSDSRGIGYVAEFGDWSRDFVGYGEPGTAWSWELDALEPAAMTALIANEIESVLDRDLFDIQVELEEERQGQIVEIAERYDDLRAHWDDVLSVIDG